MLRAKLSVRAILLLTLGALTLIVLLFAANGVYANWKRLAQLQKLREAALLSDQLFNATEAVSIERDIALTMLQSPDAATARDLQSRLRESRKAADEASTVVTSRLQIYDFPALDALRKKFLTRMAVIRSLRPQVDRDVERAKIGRDTALPGRWTTEVDKLSAETEQLWIELVRHFTNIDPIATQNLRYKHFLSTIISNVGAERSIVGQLIAENKSPTLAQIAQLSRGQGAMELSWKMSRVLAENTGLYTSVAATYSDAQSHYATLHEMIESLFYAPAAAHDGQYPIGVDLWFELSTQLSDSVMTLRQASIAAAHKYLDGLTAAAEEEILSQSIIFSLALLICAYGFFIVSRRVIHPINGMINALLAATRGERVAFEISGDRHDEIGKLGQVLSAFQVTVEETKRTAAELDKSQSVLRAVVDHAVDGLITIDAEGIVKSFNPACERIFGYGAGEIVGKHFKVLMPADDLARTFIADTIGVTGSAGREFIAKRKDGSVFPIELSISAFTLEGAQHFSGIVRDITRRKEAEHELVNYTRALERSNKELDDFAYIASHDLKEPLRGIHNHSRFLLEDNAEKLEQESVDRLGRLVHLSQRMERLVNDLLYFSRLGRQELAIQPTDLNAAIHDVESTLDVFLAERTARIVIPAPLPTIVCDKTKVTELFRNLITNAVKYNDKAQKTVEIGWLPKHKSADGSVMHNVLYVKDDGCGIHPDFHTEIFRIFKRLQGPKEKEEGTGVGLTFVKKIIERHGGKIWLESEPGQGTTFFFTLEASHDEHDFGAQVAA